MIIDLRNALEHDFAIPKKSDANDAYELANLFLSSTERYLTDEFVGSLEIGDFSQFSVKFLENLEKGIRISFGGNNGKSGKRFLVVFIVDEVDTGKHVVIDSDNQFYVDLIKYFIVFRDDGKKDIGDKIKKILIQL